MELSCEGREEQICGLGEAPSGFGSLPHTLSHSPSFFFVPSQKRTKTDIGQVQGTSVPCAVACRGLGWVDEAECRKTDNANAPDDDKATAISQRLRHRYLRHLEHHTTNRRSGTPKGAPSVEAQHRFGCPDCQQCVSCFPIPICLPDRSVRLLAAVI
jgi:hypothetical protein